MFEELFVEFFGWVLLDLIGASVRFILGNFFNHLRGKKANTFKY